MAFLLISRGPAGNTNRFLSSTHAAFMILGFRYTPGSRIRDAIHFGGSVSRVDDLTESTGSGGILRITENYCSEV